MEWNTKPSLLWDLENLFEFDAKAAENPKKLVLTDCSIEGDQFVGSGSFYSVEDGGGSRGTGGSGSELGHTSSKSSKSASMYSSSIEESKTTKFTLESSEGLHRVNSGKKGSHKVKPLGSSPTLEISAGSGEPLLSLKLGKRMYFEDISAGHNMKPYALSALPVSSATTGKKCKPASQSSTLNPLCQVEGCNIDLSSAKDYHRKHRICESHSKSPRVVVAGAELRFCQQCSRFHGLAEFDDEKRSCRKRLSDHNARRRKPQPEAVRLNPTRLSSLYGERQPMNFIFDQAPTPFTRQNANLNWDVTESSYFGHTREYMSKPTKAGGSPGKLCFPNSKMSRTGTVLYHDFNRTSPSKGTSSEVLNPGLEDHGISSNLNANQDLNHALSLLSTSSWVSCETKPVSVDVRSVTQQANVPQPALNAMTQGLPLASGYWQAQQLPVDNSMHIPHSRSDGGSHFQDLSFFRTPYDSGLFSSQFN